MGAVVLTKKVRRNLFDYGFRRTVVKCLTAMLKPVFCVRTYRLYRADLAHMEIAPAAASSFAIRFIRPDEEDCIRQIVAIEEWLSGIVQSTLASGGKCLVALDGKRVAGFNLVSFERIHLPVVHYRRPLGPNQAFSEQISVSRDYRGKGLAATLRFEIFRALKAEGKTRIYGGTDPRNDANLALCRKVGLKEIADLRYVRVLWMDGTSVRRLRR